MPEPQLPPGLKGVKGKVATRSEQEAHNEAAKGCLNLGANDLEEPTTTGMVTLYSMRLLRKESGECKIQEFDDTLGFPGEGPGKTKFVGQEEGRAVKHYKKEEEE